MLYFQEICLIRSGQERIFVQSSSILCFWGLSVLLLLQERFYAGDVSQLPLGEPSRTGEGPVAVRPTTSSRALSGDGAGMSLYGDWRYPRDTEEQQSTSGKAAGLRRALRGDRRGGLQRRSKSRRRHQDKGALAPAKSAVETSP